MVFPAKSGSTDWISLASKGFTNTINFIHLLKRQHNCTKKYESENVTNQQHKTLIRYLAQSAQWRHNDYVFRSWNYLQKFTFYNTNVIIFSRKEHSLLLLLLPSPPSPLPLIAINTKNVDDDNEDEEVEGKKKRKKEELKKRRRTVYIVHQLWALNRWLSVSEHFSWNLSCGIEIQRSHSSDFR